MQDFDKLTPSLRRALHYSIEAWGTAKILKLLQSKGEAQTLQILSINNQKELEKREDQPRRAIGPYKGLVPQTLALEDLGL